MSAARTAIVTVSFNSAEVLPAMLGSVPDDIPVVAVDNASADNSADIARAAGATVVQLDTNEGFGRACNAGAAQCGTEYILFLNPDAALKEGAIAALENAADRYPESPAFNPRIETSSGKVSFKRRSMLVERSRWTSHAVPEDGAELPMLIGGAMFCRRSCFEAVGGFDPAIFLYHEDEDLSVRLAQKFGPLRFVSGARVVHDAGHSSGRSAKVARFKGYHMARSKVHVLRKHGLRFPLARTLSAAIAGMAMPHNFLSARRRAKHAGMISGAMSMWISGTGVAAANKEPMT